MAERSFTALPMIKNPLHYIHKYPQLSQRVLGIEYHQFLQLLEQAELKHNEQKGHGSSSRIPGEHFYINKNP